MVAGYETEALKKSRKHTNPSLATPDTFFGPESVVIFLLMLLGHI